MSLKKLVIYTFLLVICVACKATDIDDNGVKKLKENETIDYLDLSNKGLQDFPDLSKFHIKNLNISHNEIKSFDLKYLPKGIVQLNMSFNKFKGSTVFYNSNTLTSIDISNNMLDTFALQLPNIKKINVSNNRLTYLRINKYLRPHDVNNDIGIMDTLNISNNKDLSPILKFPPTIFKTIIREGIKNGDSLQWEHKVDKNGTPIDGVISINRVKKN